MTFADNVTRSIRFGGGMNTEVQTDGHQQERIQCDA